MADYFMRHIRLRRVERCGMMTNVLRGEEDIVSQGFEEDARLDQPGHRLKAKAADGLDLRRHLSHLRNAITRQVQVPDTFQVFGAGMTPVSRFERFLDSTPHLVLF